MPMLNTRMSSPQQLSSRIIMACNFSDCSLGKEVRGTCRNRAGVYVKFRVADVLVSRPTSRASDEQVFPKPERLKNLTTLKK